MTGLFALRILPLLLLTAGGALLDSLANSAQLPQVPAIRTGITIVPVDVRVLDKDGRPVTDLTQDDFTVFEDGVRQQVKHFSASALVPETPMPGVGPPFRRPGPVELLPHTRRVVLIVLGRGRLQEPAKGTDAVIKLVRERLLPQDYVSVLAYNRATDFTTDHSRIVKVLERFKRQNDALETKLASYFSGLRAVYGSSDIPRSIQADIDRVFEDPEAPPSRRLPTGRIADRQRLSEDTRRAADALVRAEVIETRENVLKESVTDADFINVPFDQFVFESAQTRTDVEGIYAGVEYLRHIDGEKHLLFLSERGLYLPRLENDRSLAAVASDARVAVHTIHTGGLGNPPSPFSWSPHRAPELSKRLSTAPPPPQLSFRDRNAAQSMANISQLTGGISSRFAYADIATRRFDAATRFQYLIGYAPSNTDWNGRFRRIVVRVNRPGVTVLYRRGYFGRDQLVPYDRQQFLTYSRVVSAGNYAGVIGDIPVAVSVPAAQPAPGEVDVELTIDVSRVRFTRKDDLNVAALTIALFCGDSRRRLVGELWQTAELKMRDDTLAQISKEGFRHKVRVPVNERARYVKAVVYDTIGDTLGSTVIAVK